MQGVVGLDRQNDWLTIGEAAKTLGVSKDTIRRRIKDGKMYAEKREGPFGLAYYIPANELHAAFEMVPVVQIQEPIGIAELMEMLTEGVQRVTQDSVQQSITPLRNDISGMKELQEQAIGELRKEISELKDLLAKQPEPKRPWWKFWD
jgi:excisionase family DNA binding protein